MMRWAMLQLDPYHGATKLSSAISPPFSLPFSAPGKWAGPIGMLQPDNSHSSEEAYSHSRHSLNSSTLFA